MLTEKDLQRRAEIQKLMLNGKHLHVGALELVNIGDINSVPALLATLKKNPPTAGGGMICTTGHALQALRKITGANTGIRYEDWNSWCEKYLETQKANESIEKQHLK